MSKKPYTSLTFEKRQIIENMAKKKQITVIMSLHEIDLAQKIADKIICVKGDTISHFGKPEDIFEENMIKELYEINNGFFDPLFGSIELPKPDGEAKTFVICGNGTGIPIFRQLQKEHTPLLQVFFTPMTWITAWQDYWLQR